MATNEELEAQIKELEGLLVAEGEAPSGPEYSFPVPGQPIDQDQFRLLSLHGGNGILDRGGRPYWLKKHSSDSVTNSKGTLILTVSKTTKNAAALVGGYYHVLNEDREIPFGPVLANTTRYVCLTFDPRVIDEQGNQATGAVSIQTYDNEIPTTFGRINVALWAVKQKPNQLLSDAEIITYRPKIAPRIAVDTYEALPEPSGYLWGTQAFVADRDATYRAYGSSEETGGPTQWRSVDSPKWRDISLSGSWAVKYNKPQYAVLPTGQVIFRGTVQRANGANFAAGEPGDMVTLPLNFAVTTHASCAGTSSRVVRVQCNQNTGNIQYWAAENVNWFDISSLVGWIE